jgi:hypothetical protein
MTAKQHFTTLEEAQKYLKENWEKGVDCPCCGRLVKLYPYNLNANACVSLIWIYRLGKEETDGWVHVQRKFTEVFGRNATAMSYITLKHWDFIEPQASNEDPDKNASGLWRITARGKQFLKGSMRVSKTAMVYKDNVREFRGESINIHEALTVKFSYDELMNS